MFCHKMLIALLVTSSAFGLRADLNNDGIVDMQDLAILANDWLSHSCQMSDYGQVRNQISPPVLAQYFENVDTGQDEWTGVNASFSYEETHVRYFENEARSVRLTSPEEQSNSSVYWNIPESRLWETGYHSEGQVRMHDGRVYEVIESAGTSEEPPHDDWQLLYDWRDLDIHLTFYVPPKNLERISSLRAYVLDSDGQSRRLWLVLDNKPLQTRGGGWITIRKPLIHNATHPDNFDIEKGVSSVRIQLLAQTAAGGNETSVVIDRIEFVRQHDVAHYAITFDDGHANDYIVAEYMASLGLRGTFAVNPGTIGNANRLTLEQLKQMQEWGHLICNHSYSHLYPDEPTPHRSPREMVDDVVKGIEWLLDKGFERGAYIWAVPGNHSRLSHWNYDADVLTNIHLLIRKVGGPNFSEVHFESADWGTGRFVSPRVFDNHSAADACLDDEVLDRRPLIVTGWHMDGHASNGKLTQRMKEHIDLFAQKKSEGRVVDITLDQLVGPAAAISRTE